MEDSITKVVKSIFFMPLIMEKGKMKGNLLWGQHQQLRLTRICQP